MNKKVIIILSVIVAIGVISFIAIMLLNNGSDKSLNKAVGIYHNDNWNSHEATLQLNKDKTCKYPNNTQSCEWTISEDKITITLGHYTIKADNSDNVGRAIFYNTKEECEDKLEGYTGAFSLINPRCVKEGSTHEATLINNGILLYDHVFSKVN
jgi:ABC-type lipoprotein release transport system permease subunit